MNDHADLVRRLRRYRAYLLTDLIERQAEQLTELRAWRDEAIAGCAERRCAERDARELEQAEAIARKDRALEAARHALEMHQHNPPTDHWPEACTACHALKLIREALAEPASETDTAAAAAVSVMVKRGARMVMKEKP